MPTVKLSPVEYRRHKRKLALAGGLRCAKCGRPMNALDLSHRVPRGAGGGWRRDTGKVESANTHTVSNATELLCRRCHSKEPYELSKFNGEERVKR